MFAFLAPAPLFRSLALPSHRRFLRFVHNSHRSPVQMAATPSPRKRAPLRAPAPLPSPSGRDLLRLRRKASRIEAVLTEVYPEAPRGFLDHSDPFTLLVSVVLSAQTTDVRVNMVTPALFKAAPTPAAMKELGVERVQELIKSVGLAPSKARALVGLSKTIDEVHGGEVPRTMDELTRLPGVGWKTASVCGIQAFGIPAFPVDTHIHRLACRWGCGNAKSVEKTEASLRMWFPDETTWADLHTRIILFGREHCPARKHDMDSCPLCSFAATEEARRLNKLHPNKFVGAPKHKDPYSMNDTVSRPKTRDIFDDDDSDQDRLGEGRATSASVRNTDGATLSTKRRSGPRTLIRSSKRARSNEEGDQTASRGFSDSQATNESSGTGRRRSSRLKGKRE